MNSDPDMARARQELFFRILSFIRATGRKPLMWFVREDIWWLVRFSWMDDSFHFKRDPACPYTNFLFMGIPICINLRR